MEGVSRGSLAACAQSCRAKSLGTGGFSLADKTQLNVVNSTLLQHCRSNPRLPGSARKRVGAWVWSKAGGQGTGKQGPRGMGRDKGAFEARRFPVRVCQCRGAAPPPSSLDREAGPRGGCPVLSFPAGRTPPLLTACLLLVLTPTLTRANWCSCRLGAELNQVLRKSRSILISRMCPTFLPSVPTDKRERKRER